MVKSDASSYRKLKGTQQWGELGKAGNKLCKEKEKSTYLSKVSRKLAVQNYSGVCCMMLLSENSPRKFLRISKNSLRKDVEVQMHFQAESYSSLILRGFRFG